MVSVIEYVSVHTLHGGLTQVMTIARATEPRPAESIAEPQFSGEHNTARNSLDIDTYAPSKREVRQANRFYRSRLGRMVQDRDALHQHLNQPHHGLIGNNWWRGPRKAAVSSTYRKPKAAPREPISGGYIGGDTRHIVEGFHKLWDDMDNPPAVISTEQGEWDDPGAMWDDSGFDHSEPYFWDDVLEDEDYGFVHPKWWDDETRAFDYYDQRHGWNIYDGTPV